MRKVLTRYGLSFAIASLACGALATPAIAQMSPPSNDDDGDGGNGNGNGSGGGNSPPPTPVRNGPPVLPAGSFTGYADYSVEPHRSAVGYDLFNVQHVNGNSGGSAILTYSGPGLGGASGSIVAGGGQFVAASGHGGADGLRDYSYGGGASGSLNYSVSVYGPDYASVPLILTGMLKADATASVFSTSYNTRSSAHYSISFLGDYAFTGGVMSAGVSCITSNPTTQCGSVLFETDFNLASFTNYYDGTTAQVMLSANAFAVAYMELLPNGQLGSAGQADADALADPVITIDPTWSAQNPGYSVRFSHGFSNVTSNAPEPASWMMMIAGFGIIGVTLRRRKVFLKSAHPAI